jgi:hypothetical protein
MQISDCMDAINRSINITRSEYLWEEEMSPHYHEAKKLFQELWRLKALRSQLRQ